MKTSKIIVLFFTLFFSTTTMAQYGDYYYHRMGDTIYNNPNNGYFSWWDFDYFYSNNMLLDVYINNFYERHAGIILQEFFTAQTLRVIGLAGCVASYSSDRFNVAFRFPDYPSPKQEYFYLYDNDSSGIVFKGRLAWDALDTHRILIVQYHFSNSSYPDTCCHYAPLTYSMDLREYYFDSAITVNDTFFVGGSQYCNTNRNGAFEHDTLTGYYWARASGPSVNLFLTPGNCVEFDYPVNDIEEMWSHYYASTGCYFPAISHLFCGDSGTISHPAGNYLWQRDTTLSAMLVYPIIEVDTTIPPTFLCDSVQNLEASMDSSGCLTLTWDDFLHYTYCEVEYSTVQDGEDSLFRVVVYGNMLTVCDLDTSKTWRVHVRAYCDTSKQETDWTPWVEVSYTTPYFYAGMDNPSYLSRFTSLMPNPATNSVTVTSCFGMRRIEVYNTRGILIYSEPSPASSKRIDLSSWAADHYVVIIETPAGKTAKRLTVVR